MTEIEKLFIELFGASDLNEGEALEKMAAVVMKLNDPSADVAHNKYIRGLVSKTVYQTDLVGASDGINLFGEAKDYQERGSKVGRPDVQKFAGALPDIGSCGDKGVFVSSTGFTKPAVSYAAVSSRLVGHEIDLLTFTPTVERDLDGRITKIVVRMCAFFPEWEQAKWEPLITENGLQALSSIRPPEGVEYQEVELKVEFLLDSEGNRINSIREITERLCEFTKPDSDHIEGMVSLPGSFIDILGVRVEISGLKYRAPVLREDMEFEVASHSDPKLTVRGADGNIRQIFTKARLQSAQVAPDGKVNISP